MRGDAAAIESLTRVLLLSGFGMTICGGSYPGKPGRASHQPLYRDDGRRHDWDAPLHGEQIAVTTLVMARLQEELAGGRAAAPQSEFA